MTAVQPRQTTNVEQAKAYFTYVRNRIVEVTKDLSDAQWKFKPAPDRWSIAENLEHMVTVQERILGPICEQLAHAPAPASTRNNEQIDALVLEKIPDRSIRAKAPEFLDPAGQWSLAQSLDRVFGNYEQLARFVESTPDLREHVIDAPPLKIVTLGAYDSMDAYQWALAVAAHDERHVRQILEVKADPHYPRAA